MEDFQLLRRRRPGRLGGGVALYVRERLDCMVIDIRDDVTESFWMRIKGTGSKVEVVLGVYCLLPTQDSSTEELQAIRGYFGIDYLVFM